ncbi:ATP-dependent DNA ligase [Massilia endophytica]|uniref:ATP-dependent DNA ligase n=1 Tax=Massilia endophytica TaxID=2899220 RepID=UPI001E5BB92D|nr:hypothetical protein [Massilia endophytica]UGQ45069.1 hypothetical protein LSQ66_14845 [Massilia endophytica]
MLLDERTVAPTDQADYVAEIKYDGYRVLALFGDGSCRLRTRNGTDCTAWFPEVAEALGGLKGGPTIVDGEVSMLDEIGRSDFDALQARARRRSLPAGAPPVTYCVFDLLQFKGRPVMSEPLRKRKAKLAKLLAHQLDHVLYVQHLDGSEVTNPLSWLYTHALELKLEGIVGKRADSVYEPGVRSPNWFKLKRPGAVPPERFQRSKREPR